jgi:hypothetical protein
MKKMTASMWVLISLVLISLISGAVAVAGAEDHNAPQAVAALTVASADVAGNHALKATSLPFKATKKIPIISECTAMCPLPPEVGGGN